jgi:predicted RNA-binding Zn ribbon-like protein
MNTEKTIDDISFLGGHAALDFVNTVDSRGGMWGPDYLMSFQDLADWALRAGLVDQLERNVLLQEAATSSSAAGIELQNAKELRETLHRIFSAEARGSFCDQGDLDYLSDVFRRAALQRRLQKGTHGIAWSNVPAATLAAIADRIGLSAIELLTSRHQRRPVRICQGRNCGWLFLDRSRGGHRRWCSDKTCGSAARVRKFRAERVE